MIQAELQNSITQSLSLKISEYKSISNYVVFAGRITEEKGIYELIDVWKQFDNKGIKLKIIGKYSLDNINLKTIFI